MLSLFFSVLFRPSRGVETASGDVDVRSVVLVRTVVRMRVYLAGRDEERVKTEATESSSSGREKTKETAGKGWAGWFVSWLVG